VRVISLRVKSLIKIKVPLTLQLFQQINNYFPFVIEENCKNITLWRACKCDITLSETTNDPVNLLLIECVLFPRGPLLENNICGAAVYWSLGCWKYHIRQNVSALLQYVKSDYNVTPLCATKHKRVWSSDTTKYLV